MATIDPSGAAAVEPRGRSTHTRPRKCPAENAEVERTFTLRNVSKRRLDVVIASVQSTPPTSRSRSSRGRRGSARERH